MILTCLKKCFKKEKVEEVEFDIPKYLDKKAMDDSGFDYCYWGKAGRDEFVYLLQMISNNNITGYTQKDLEYISNNIKTLIDKINELLQKEESERSSGLIKDSNLYDLIQILLEVKRYQDLVS